MAQNAPSWLKGLIKKKTKTLAEDAPEQGAPGSASCKREGELGSGWKHGIGSGMGMQAEGRSSQQKQGGEGPDGCDYMCDSLLPAHPEPRLQRAVEEESIRWVRLSASVWVCDGSGAQTDRKFLPPHRGRES
jgi:hypothetical protein